MAATTAVSPVGAAFGNVFFSMQMHRPFSAVARSDMQFYVIYKIPLGHCVGLKSVNHRFETGSNLIY